MPGLRTVPVENQPSTASSWGDDGMTDQLLVSVPEAAHLMGDIDTDTVYAMCNSGQLPHIRLGRRILVSVDGMKEWIKQNDGREALAFS